MSANPETYKRPVVKLVGTDGNAFMILGKVREALRKAHAPQDVMVAFVEEATKGDYDHLLQTCMKYVDVR